MTGPRVEKPPPHPDSPEAFFAAQPTGLRRGLSPDEFIQAQGMTPTQLKAWKLPPLTDYGDMFAIAPKDAVARAQPGATPTTYSDQIKPILAAGASAVDKVKDAVANPAFQKALRQSDIPGLGRVATLQATADILDKWGAAAEAHTTQDTWTGEVVRNVVAPPLRHPWMTAGVIGASMIPVIGPVVDAYMAGDLTSHLALYGYQKTLEQEATPGARKIMEADPERISGKAAIIQAAMLGLVSAHAIDHRVSAEAAAAETARLHANMEVPATVPRPVLAAPQQTAEAPTVPHATDVADMEIPVGTNRFIGDLQQGAAEASAYARVGNQPPRPKGFEETSPSSRAGAGAEPVAGLEPSLAVRAARVKALETEPLAATAEARAAQHAELMKARRAYEEKRLAQDQSDLSAARQAAADKIAQADAMRPRRRAAAFVQSEAGAEAMGTAAAQQGLPSDASPFPPNTTQDVAYKSGHDAVTGNAPPEPTVPSSMTATGEAPAGLTPPAEPTPSYPEGFSMGGESRIPAKSELPKVARGTNPPPETTSGGEGSGLATVEGTGETKTRGLAAGVAEKAVANKLDAAIGDLPEYSTVKMADQAARATDVLTRDPALARQIALGKTPAPDGVLPEAVFTAVENKAIADGDAQTLYDLAHGDLTTQATTMGQRIRALGERDPDSPVGIIKDINRVKSGGQNVQKQTLSTVKDIEEHFSGLQVAEKAWKDFLESLKC